MADKYPPTVQRPALLKLVEALGCRDNALRRDSCGDWCIKGRFGHIWAVPGIPWGGMEGVEGFQIYYRGASEFKEPTSTQAWTWAKKVLSFATVTQDGDDEGILFLGRLPTPTEAILLRDKLRIPKRPEYGEEEMARRRKWASTVNESSGRKSPDKESVG